MVIIDTEDVVVLNTLSKLPQLLSPLKLLPIDGAGFLGFAPLRVGITVLTCYFIMTASASTIHNLMLYDSSVSFACVLLYLVNIYIIFIWGMTICGLLLDKFTFIKYTLFMWTSFVLLWMFIVICTFFESGITILCINSRCPESLWLYRNSWHEIKDPVAEFRPPSPKDNIMDTLRDTGEKISRSDWISSSFLTALKELDDVEEGNVRSHKEQQKFGKFVKPKEDPSKLITSFHNIGLNNLKSMRKVNLIVLIVMVLFNIVILFYSWFILLSYYAEAKCVAECLCEEEQRASNNSNRCKRVN